MFILGSTSPRRKELLSKIVSDFKILSPQYNEECVDKTSKHYALEEAKGKASSLIPYIKKDDCLICCDTIVFLNNKIYGKPKNKEDAFKILKELSNNVHTVISGYVIIYNDIVLTKEVNTYVKFNELDDTLINRYIDETNPMDKAGAYAIQEDNKYHLIQSIEGTISNVMGFPIEDIKEDLIKLGLL